MGRKMGMGKPFCPSHRRPGGGGWWVAVTGLVMVGMGNGGGMRLVPVAGSRAA